ncbi:MAG: beta-lactamase family protein [Lentimicrobiaceae bacterium]|nr:beta-lactamase family protein [Lentimicrobiaceae bacterium]
MKNKHLILLSTILFTLFSIISCQKEHTADPNQLLIDQMKAVTDSIIKNTSVPGIVALVVDKKRGIDWLYAAGVSDKVTNAPMDVNHTFRIASNTKTFTGTVLLQLVGEGRISLNDKVTKYFPQYAAASDITLTMLANMTSGLFDYFDDERWVTGFKTQPLRVWTPEEIVDLSFSHPLLFGPGTQYKYTNTNTILLGMIIEKVTGNKLETEINNRIVTPLNLKNTGFLTSGATLPGNHGRGYDFGELGITGDVTESYDVSNSGAAGAVYTTPRELQLFVERMVEGGLLPDSLQDRRLNKDFNQFGPVQSYGLCLTKMGSFYGHNGVIWGYVSSMYHSPEKQCTVIIYYNLCQPAEYFPDSLFLRFMEILYSKYIF